MVREDQLGNGDSPMVRLLLRQLPKTASGSVRSHFRSRMAICSWYRTREIKSSCSDPNPARRHNPRSFGSLFRSPTEKGSLIAAQFDSSAKSEPRFYLNARRPLRVPFEGPRKLATHAVGPVWPRPNLPEENVLLPVAVEQSQSHTRATPGMSAAQAACRPFSKTRTKSSHATSLPKKGSEGLRPKSHRKCLPKTCSRCRTSLDDGR